jgi:hypothetical protein
MYANNGRFYVDVDNRHWFQNLVLLLIGVGILLFIRFLLSEFTRYVFRDEREATIDFISSVLRFFRREKDIED